MIRGARAYHYQGDFITHSGSSELSLDSESKLEPSVAKARLNLAQLN